MRWLVLTLAAVLFVPATTGAQQAWAKAYEDGVKAFENGNDALAEQKLKEAREHDRAPKQSRRANFSSVVYRPFIPDFYLGVIYVRTGRVKQGQEYLERAMRDELVKQEDRANFALATSALQRSREDQAKLASSTTTRPAPPPEVVRPPVNQTPPPNNPPVGPTTPNAQTPTNTSPGNATTPATVRPLPPVTPADPAWLPRFRQAMEAAQLSLRQSRYADARGHLASAETLAGDAMRRQEATALRRSIDAAQSVDALRTADRARAAIAGKNLDAAQTQVAQLEALAPGHSALARLRADVERLRGSLQGVARTASIERLGVKLFLSGKYKESADQLERAVGNGMTSPRIHLFLASSRAAQALLAPQAERPALVAEAQRHYALARPGAAALTTDQQFISPSILKLLTGS
jgi:tetratricopeptide (TPR) repeat protein